VLLTNISHFLYTTLHVVDGRRLLTLSRAQEEVLRTTYCRERLAVVVFSIFPFSLYGALCSAISPPRRRQIGGRHKLVLETNITIHPPPPPLPRSPQNN
jgi:hypothetical protein